MKYRVSPGLSARLALATAALLLTSLAPTLHAGGGSTPVPPPPLEELRPHLVTLDNQGILLSEGAYPTPEEALEEVLGGGAHPTSGSGPERLLIYAHGGMVHLNSGVRRVQWHKQLFLPEGIYPVDIVWRTSIQETLHNIFRDAFREAQRSRDDLEQVGPEGWDWLDNILEPIFRNLGGRLIWGEIKENAWGATTRADGGMRKIAQRLATRRAGDPGLQIHLAGHSAGSILLAPFASYLSRPAEQGGLGVQIDSVTLWAAAVSIADFRDTYLPDLLAGRIRHLTLFNLDDAHEQDDSVGPVYHKSVLYLVQNALEEARHEPILGVTASLLADPELRALVEAGTIELVTAPNDFPEGTPDASRANSHINYEFEPVTVKGLGARILTVSDRTP